MPDPPSAQDDARDGRVGQVLDGYLERLRTGQAEPEARLLAEHPDLADELRSHLDMIRHLRPDQSTIDSLVAQGVLERSDQPGYPAKLGAYKVSAFLGRGGMGVVLKAYEESLNRTVALKILRPDLADDETAVARFTREAKAAAALQHPNIVTVYAVGREGQAQYLAMEYVEGPTLAEVIRDQGPLPAEMVREVFRQLLSGLAAAHEAGLIHRDVKSSNILLDGWYDGWHGQAEGPKAPELVRGEVHRAMRSARGGVHDPGTSARTEDLHRGTGSERGGVHNPGTSARAEARGSESAFRIPNSAFVRLADFGLARMVSAQTRLTLDGSTPGTPEYMSPEQARGDSELDQRTDLYSAGVVLYEMLTGRTPFRADSPTAVIHRILHEEPPDPRTISETADSHLSSLALRLMAKRPEDRFDSATAVITALDAHERVRSLERHRRFRRRVAGAACLLALLCWGAWMLTHIGGRRLITDAQIDPDSGRTIQVRYGDDARWRRFHGFPANQEIELSDAALLDVDGHGQQMIIAGAMTRLDDLNNVVIAFKPSGHEAWRIPLHSALRWPDCEVVSRWWAAEFLTKGELNSVPGEELVVVAKHVQEYPGRISIVDPATGEVRSTFWHLGQIAGIRLIPSFFEDGRAAVLAWGHNNKLDGFSDGLRDGERRFTGWDVVHVLMILDPMSMDGLGPPAVHTNRFPESWKPALPYAYAFLDLPSDPRLPYVSDDGTSWNRELPEHLIPGQTGGILAVEDAPLRPDPDTGPWFGVVIWGRPADGESGIRTYLIVDRNLELRRLAPAPPAAEDQHTKEYWETYWHPIIENGEYLTD